MRELLDDLDRWAAAGRRAVLARVVDTEGSGPRLPGAAMAVSEDGEVSGSVSGGCVEGAVVAEALDVLERGDTRLVSFGYSDDEAVGVGLTCGGTVHLLLAPVPLPGGVLAPLAAALREGRPAVLATRLDAAGGGACLLVAEPRPPDDGAGPPGGADLVLAGSLGDADLDRVVRRDARGALASATTAVRHYGPHGEAGQDALAVFVECFAAPPRMVIFGAVDFTAALAHAAKLLGYHVTVCDARAVFATRARFPMADEVVVAWPQRHLAQIGPTLGPRDAVCVLTHDHKFDVPAIVAGLGTRVGYLGAMGSRRTHAERLERLRAEGVDDADLARLWAPIGLDIGARTPEETAVAILAEIIATRSGREAASLRDGRGPIHAG
ncbi:MAG: XdhC/CoxI family protein [Acidimicrobiales bacterium]